MLRPIDNWYLNLEEPANSCLSYLRNHILQYNEGISEAWKYGMPFFCYKGRMVCYLWIHKKFKHPYLGIVEGSKVKDPDLLQEKRARMKILLLDPRKNIPVKKIDAILKQILALY